MQQQRSPDALYLQLCLQVLFISPHPEHLIALAQHALPPVLLAQAGAGRRQQEGLNLDSEGSGLPGGRPEDKCKACPASQEPTLVLVRTAAPVEVLAYCRGSMQPKSGLKFGYARRPKRQRKVVTAV